MSTTLSISDFQSYFEKRHLGKLSFPNGVCIETHGQFIENAEFPKFNIELMDLYKMITDWKIEKKQVNLNDIVAIIAFGSAVDSSGVKTVETSRKKYMELVSLI